MALDLDFLSLFSGNSSPPLAGLDIGLSTIKLVELSRKGRHIRLEHYGCEPLLRGAIVDGHIEDMEQVISATRRLWKKSGCRARHVAIGLPSASVITKVLTLPAGIDEEAMRTQVEAEAAHLIPFPLDEVSLDFDVTGPAPDQPGHVQVLLAAARRDKVDDRIAIAQAIGVKPQIIDVNTLAAQAAVHRTLTDPRETTCLVEIGPENALLSLSRGQHILYEREHAFGIQGLTDQIAETYGLSADEAETKKRFGGLPAGYREDILQPFINRLVVEIVQAVQLCSASVSTPPDRILLAGGGALLRGIADAVKEHTRISTDICNPFHGMQFAKAIREPALRAEAPLYLVACGLALRKFDHVQD